MWTINVIRTLPKDFWRIESLLQICKSIQPSKSFNKQSKIPGPKAPVPKHFQDVREGPFCLSEALKTSKILDENGIDPWIIKIIMDHLGECHVTLELTTCHLEDRSKQNVAFPQVLEEESQRKKNKFFPFLCHPIYKYWTPYFCNNFLSFQID